MRALAWTLLAIGVIAGLYFLVGFDIGVDTGSGYRVANAQKMNDRLTGTIFGIGMAVVGAIMLTRSKQV